MKGFFTPYRGREHRVTFAVLVLAILKRDLGFKGFVKSVDESLRTACMVIMLIAGSAILGHFIAVTNIPMLAADWIACPSFATLDHHGHYLTVLPVGRFIHR